MLTESHVNVRSSWRQCPVGRFLQAISVTGTLNYSKWEHPTINHHCLYYTVQYLTWRNMQSTKSHEQILDCFVVHLDQHKSVVWFCTNMATSYSTTCWSSIYAGTAKFCWVFAKPLWMAKWLLIERIHSSVNMLPLSSLRLYKHPNYFPPPAYSDTEEAVHLSARHWLSTYQFGHGSRRRQSF